MKNYTRLTALERIKHCRSQLLLTQPFYGVLALSLIIVEAPHITDTMAVDGTHLFYNPAYVLSLPERELIGVIAHEVSHCSYGHHWRIGARELERANIAADYAINRDLKAAGFTLPQDTYFDARFHGMGFEEIYAILTREEKAKQAQQKPQDGSGQGQQGQGAQPSQGQPKDGQQGQNGQPQSGQGGQPQQGHDGTPSNGAAKPQTGGQGAQGQPSGQNGSGTPSSGPMVNPDGNKGGHGIGGIMRPSPADMEAQEIKWQVATRQAAAVAKKHNAGTMPGYLQTVLDEINKPVIDVRDLLANFIDSTIASDYSFSKPNRRYISSGFYLPSAVVDALAHLVFIIDTSGSITAAMLRTATNVVREAMEAGKVERCTVIMADTRVAHVQEFGQGDEINLILRGGGGTRFDAALQHVVENFDDATAIIYLTDMECKEGAWGIDPEIPLLWAVHSKPASYERLAAKAPFGECVYVGQL